MASPLDKTMNWRLLHKMNCGKISSQMLEILCKIPQTTIWKIAGVISKLPGFKIKKQG